MSEIYRVLVLGSGGREHSLIESIIKSPLCQQIYTNNIEFSKITNAKFIDTCGITSDFTTLISQCKDEGINYVIPGQEAWLGSGIVDAFQSEGIGIFGPIKSAARLEVSKSFTKEMCNINNIPTARFAYFTDVKSACKFADKIGYPVVVKYDGLAEGKGVFICEDSESAYKAIEDIVLYKIGDKISNVVIIEEFLKGKELSFFVLFDGNQVVVLDAVQDYKQVTCNDKILNTGGMGSYTPVKTCTSNLKSTILRNIIYPTIQAVNFRGVLFAGLMLCKNGPKLLEYNVRFGDPETQSLLARLETDLLSLLIATMSGELSKIELKMKNCFAVCIVIASKWYPLSYKKDVYVTDLNTIKQFETDPEVKILFAGVKISDDGKIYSNGGRVLNIVVTSATLLKARKKAYTIAGLINWSGGFYIEKIAE